jgi:oligopeptide transport system ATP-binding protein
VTLLAVRDVVVEYAVPAGPLRAPRRLRVVDGVSLDVASGEALGIVGESGCGKTTLARAMLGLVPLAAGSVRLDGMPLAGLAAEELRRLRSRMQIVFQDPLSALDPRMTVGQIVAEPLRVHRGDLSAAERRERVAVMLERVGLSGSIMGRYPHEFSGGQCQRIGIARALVLKPDLVVCDEPVSALDLSVRAQILALLAELREEMGLALVFIAHDLAAVRQLCQRVMVMYAGRSAELAATETLFSRPLHPYARAAGRDPAGGPGRRAPHRAARGRAALAGRSAQRLPLPRPLPARHGRLRRRAPARPKPARRPRRLHSCPRVAAYCPASANFPVTEAVMTIRPVS